MQNNVFEIKNLSFSYDKDKLILNDVSVNIPIGKITVIIGPNGSGKSTLFSLLSKLNNKYSGKILFKGENISCIKRRDYAKMLSVVHQSNVAPSDMTVKRLVSMGRNAYHGPFFSSLNEEDELEINNALNITDTYKLKDRYISELSGGQSQRVWLALALAQSKDVLLLDEITTYLDVHYQYQLLNAIRELNKQFNSTIVLVLHDINQAIRYADNIIIMSDGKVINSGSVSDVITENNISNTYNIKTKIVDILGEKNCIFDK